MAEWLVERGIGETRAALVEDGAIVEARIELDGHAPAGTVIAARLVDIGTNGRNAIASRRGRHRISAAARRAGRRPRAPTLTIEVTREAIPGSRAVEAAARAADRHGAPKPAPLAGRELALPAAGRDELGDAGLGRAARRSAHRRGRVRGRRAAHFADAGDDADRRRRLACRPTSWRCAARPRRREPIRRLDIGGSIGIDFPTVGGKAARQAAAEAIDATLPQPFERTAVNGFGFVQIVRPRLRASLLELAQDRAAFEARALLRRAAFEPAGAKRLVAHPR